MFVRARGIMVVVLVIDLVSLLRWRGPRRHHNQSGSDVLPLSGVSLPGQGGWLYDPDRLCPPESVKITE